MIAEFIVTTGEKTKRLDKFLANHERGASRSRLQRLILAGRVHVNEKMAKPSHRVLPGDRIVLDQPEPGPLLVNGRKVPLEILYEDETLLVVNKPAGVVVHPTSGHWTGTLFNGLLAHFQDIKTRQGVPSLNQRPGLVHRLDKETSGVMVVAKTDVAHRALCSQFEKQSIARIYEALVYGSPANISGRVNTSLGRDAVNRMMISTNTLKPQTAITEFRVLRFIGTNASLLELIPHTGRQHQLRVHMASIGCPILGDPLYGDPIESQIRERESPRMFLHARTLRFCHPQSGKMEEFCSGIPDEMKGVMELL